MSRLTNLSLAHRTVVLLLALLAIGLGVYTTTALKQELIPSLDLPRGSVITVYPGASPELVESEVSKPIEAAVKGVEGVTTVTSKSSSSVSQVTMQWEYGNDPDKIAADISSALDGISNTLPDVDPQVITGSFDDIPVLIVALSSDADPATVSQQTDDIVVPELKSLAGVRDVTVGGEQAHEVIVTYNEKKLRDAGIDPSTIGQLFMANSTAFPSGTIRTDNANLDVQTGKTYSSISDIENLWLQGTDGPVQVKSVATVAEEPVETTSISRVNGRSALTLSITKNSGANTVTVAHEVRDTLDRLQGQLGNGASFALVFDQAPFIEQSIHDLSVEGGIGLAMAVLVIMLFLGSIRPTLITAISIPLALLIALIGLYVGGYSLNILTLGALTVAIGRVVDDSIVVIENIKRHQASGEHGIGSIVGAVREVAGAVTSSTLTTVAVFVPIGLVGGQAGEMFRPFALTVTIALLASLLVALTVVPVFAYWFMKPTARQLETRAEEKETNTWLHRGYMPVLGWTLRHRAITLLLALAIFAGTLALTPLLKTDFIGSMGENMLQITQKLPNGTGLSETDAAARKVEAVLDADDAVESYQTSIGGSSAIFMGSQTDTNQATYTVMLAAGVDMAEVADRVRAKIAEAGSDLGDVEVSVGANQSTSQVVVYVESSDPTALATGNDQVLAMMKKVNGLTNVTSDLGEARDMLSVNVDEKKAAKLGMTQAGIGQAVARAVRGQQIGTLAEGDKSLDIYLRSQKPVKNVEELREIKLPVTQKMVMDARTDAADKVQERSDKLADDAKADAQDAYDEQVSALKKSRSQAKKSVSSLQKQLKSANKRFASLQRQLAAIPQRCIPTDPSAPPPAVTDPETCGPVPAAMFSLTQEMSAVGSQIAQLSAGIAQAKAGVTQVDKQLDALAEQRDAQQEAQDKQQALQDDAKAAQELDPAPVKLKDVAAVDVVDAPNGITRVDGTRAATLTAVSDGGNLGTTTSDIQTGLAALDLPDGVSVRIGGVSQQQQDAFAQLGLAMVVAIAVVYLIMVATFGSLLQPLILLVSIPFAATGALGLSLATDTPIGVPSMIGLLMLIGIVVTNAIVLIDLINQKRKAGAGVDGAIEAGARLRVRPIVMTALATIFALVPMALGITGGGVFISKPLGIVVIGGLVSSTVLTLILVPVLYDVLEKWRENRAARRAGRRPSVAEPVREGTPATAAD